MKLSDEYSKALRAALASRGLTSEGDREPGQPHTDESAVRQVLLSRAYGHMGKKALDDICVLSELGSHDEAMQWISDAVDEVAGRKRL